MNVLLSLLDPATTVRKTFSEYAQHAASNNYPISTIDVLQKHRALSYCPTEYLNLLIKEIAECPIANDTAVLPGSTKLLMDHGLEMKFAVELAEDVFQQVITTMSLYLPTVSFGDMESYRIGLCNESDLFIALPSI